jgi:glycosyltransferase involved in cell wall biosynthesis
MEHRYETSAPTLKAFGLDYKNYVLYLGRFSPEKNCHLLIRAFEGLDTAMKLVLAGGSSHTDEYVTSLRRHVSEKIHILDWISGERLDDLLNGAAVFVLPSDMEGMSLALLDAMGAGVCVLASDVPENIETVADAGFTFKAGDGRDLQRTLEFLLANPSLRQEAGLRAQERVRQYYLWDNVALEMSCIYKALIGRTPRKASLPIKTPGRAA